MSQNDDLRVISPTEIGLKIGSKGPPVGELQRYLARFGYLPLDASLEERLRGISEVSISEVFDDETREALSAYQTFHGFRATGQLNEVTVGQMAVPRCGVPDIWRVEDLSFRHLRFVLAGTSWKTFDLRYGFVNFSPDSTRARIRTVIAAAFRTWSDATDFVFHREETVQVDTEILIQFAAGNHGDGISRAFDGPGGVLAHGFYPPSSGFGADITGDIHFDEAELWNTDAVVPIDRYDLQTLATHEIGHALGLKHSTERGAIMWPSFSLGTPKRTLHQDDIDGMEAIYGQRRRVPYVQELRPAAAASRVRAEDLKPVFTGTFGPNAWVWHQSPRAGKQVAVDSEVSMQLRNGQIP